MTNDFVKVASNDYNPELKKRLVQTEIVRKEDLIKIFKDCGNEGTALVFDYMINGHKCQRRYDFKNTMLRDEAFEKYERILCGDVVKTYEDRVGITE